MKPIVIIAAIAFLAAASGANAQQTKTRKMQDTMQKNGRDTMNRRHVRIDTTTHPYDSIPHKTIKGR